jgi:hypothetical protein
MTESSPTPANSASPEAGRRSALARYWWVAGLAIAGGIAILAAVFASGDPDGLDSVAIDRGFEGATKDPGFEILPGYAIPGLDGTVSTIVAGVVGIAVIFLLTLLLGRLLARRRKDTAA